MRGPVRWCKPYVHRYAPSLYYLHQYRLASRSISESPGERKRLWKQFLRAADGPCLQIAIKDSTGGRYGPNWTVVDRYDPRADRDDDIQALDFPDDTFAAAVCWSVLEHVPDPQRAVGELRRALRPGGLIWVQLPFLYPYHRSPEDYWRVTPDGLRQWMRGFEEIACACTFGARTPLIAGTYFYGRKR
jgi:SAM-dependent methyltransferase